MIKLVLTCFSFPMLEIKSGLTRYWTGSLWFAFGLNRVFFFGLICFWGWIASGLARYWSELLLDWLAELFLESRFWIGPLLD